LNILIYIQVAFKIAATRRGLYHGRFGPSPVSTPTFSYHSHRPYIQYSSDSYHRQV